MHLTIVILLDGGKNDIVPEVPESRIGLKVGPV